MLDIALILAYTVKGKLAKVLLLNFHNIILFICIHQPTLKLG